MSEMIIILKSVLEHCRYSRALIINDLVMYSCYMVHISTLAEQANLYAGHAGVEDVSEALSHHWWLHHAQLQVSMLSIIPPLIGGQNNVDDVRQKLFFEIIFCVLG